jgi:hypothetical protein
VQGSVLHVQLAENTELGARQGQELMQLGAGLKNAAIGGQGLEIIKLSTLGLTGTQFACFTGTQFTCFAGTHARILTLRQAPRRASSSISASGLSMRLRTN